MKTQLNLTGCFVYVLSAFAPAAGSFKAHFRKELFTAEHGVKLVGKVHGKWFMRGA